MIHSLICFPWGILVNLTMTPKLELYTHKIPTAPQAYALTYNYKNLLTPVYLQ